MGKDISDKRLIFKVHKEFIQPEPKKKKKNLIKKWARELNRHFSKDNIQVVNKYMERWSMSLTIKAMKSNYS